MKTKFDLSQITTTKVEERLKYSDYKKAFAKELKRVKSGDTERCIVITKYEFADNKKRPLLVLGVSNDWKDYIKKETKTNKFFGVGDCAVTTKEDGGTDLNVTINKGKVGDSEINKSFQKYAPVDNLVLKAGAKELEGDEKIDELEGEAGFKLFSKSTFAKIKTKLKDYKAIHPEEYETRLSTINELRDLIATWLEKHKAAKDKSEKAKREELLKVRAQLDKAFASIKKKYDEDPNSIGSGAVVNLDPGDKVIDDAADTISRVRKLGKDLNVRRKDDPLTAHETALQDQDHGEVLLAKDVDFSITGNDAPIVLLAHGSPATDRKYKQVHATHFGSKSPKEIVSFLIKRKLPKSYAGVIYIDGCYTAAGNTPQNYCMKIYKMLVKQGYQYLQIKGNLGLAATTSSGKELVTFAQLEKEAEKLKKAIKEKDQALVDCQARFEKAIKPDIDQLEKEKKAAEAEYKVVMKASLRKDMTEEEKKEAFKKLEETEFRQIHNRIRDLRASVADSEEYLGIQKAKQDLQKELDGIRIEELTGTFGPEKLPPKS